MISSSQVFVAGGQPTYTYNPRAALRLETSVRNYLFSPFKVLSVTGPTKSGKTVLVRNQLPRDRAIWVSGGQMSDLNTLWEIILQRANLFSTLSKSEVTSSTETKGRNLDASAKIAGFGGAVKTQYSEAEQTSTSSSSARTVSSSVPALEYLVATKVPLVIDDFHYIAADIQASLIRALKEPIYEGVPVILIAVPHRAYDVVRVEREMTGRVVQLPIPSWENNELREIADKGFQTLNLSFAQAGLDRIVAESFASPHLIQDFCLQICIDNGITEESKASFSLPEPADWNGFFKTKASGTSKTAFDRLAIGPKQRSDRKKRKLKTGTECDIYRVVLLAIAQLGPRAQLQYEEIRTALRDLLDDQLPQAHEVTRVLDQMSRIAREEIQGEAVVDWDKEWSVLHVSDPFFAYYLKWGVEFP